MSKKDKLNAPRLICARKPHKNRNDGFYRVEIPITFMPKNSHCIGFYQSYYFIGLNYE